MYNVYKVHGVSAKMIPSHNVGDNLHKELVIRKEKDRMEDRIFLKAYGKINLALDVLGKREDGYHEVRMIMQTVGLYDGIEIIRNDSGKIEIESNVFFVPVNESNIAYKAAKMLLDEFQLKDGVHIAIKKFIPVSGGMAGGSTDAASVLFGMNKLFGLGLNMRDLMERGVNLGADVPYCLMRGTALSEGIGEKLKRLPDMVQCPVLIAKPPISVSTKFVYENLKLTEVTKHPDIDGMIEALQSRDLNGIASRLGNVLETVTIEQYPKIQKIKEEMLEQGAINSIMSGSGPTVFGLFKTSQEAYAAKERLKELNYAKQLFVTEMFSPGARK